MNVAPNQHGPHLLPEPKLIRAVIQREAMSKDSQDSRPTGDEKPRRPSDGKAPHARTNRAGPAERWPQLSGEMVMTTEPVDHPSRETVKVRQGTGPRATVSVLLVSLVAATIAGAILIAYFVWAG